MLESIIVKKVATYNETGIIISGLRKINFIYGSNGSGKTTITKCVASPTETCFSDCTLIWKNGIPIKALVYNKDFREKNFGKGKMDGVFTLGQATKEQIEAITLMQKELEELKDKGIKKKLALEKLTSEKQILEDEFRENVWTDIYKEYENDFKQAFVGFQKKETFKTKILETYDGDMSDLKTYEELKEKAATIFGNMPTMLPTISFIDFARLTEIEDNPIWKKKIIGKADVPIATLVQKLNINDWVNEGRNYLREEDETCPFCQAKTIKGDFRQQLEAYFDETFTTDTAFVKSLSEEYSRIAQNVNNIIAQIETLEKSNVNSKLSIEIFAALSKTLASQFVLNREILSNKLKEPSRILEPISVKKQLESIKLSIDSANAEIDKHNQIVANYSSERAQLINSVWKYLAGKNKNQIDQFNKKHAGLQRGLDALKKQHENLRNNYRIQDAKIKEANRDVTSVQPSVDEINRILKSFGFLNFQIVPSQTEKNQYQILREDGTVAESTLSEGEVTFITFLYFLQLAKGSTDEGSITEERILVIDDPISSLDSNVLFIISSLLKEIIKKVKADEDSIKQLILLTHNVYFHKEVSFVDGRTKQNSDTYYWILRKNENTSIIENYEMNNPIQNSYELLWQELKNKNNNSGITVQNIMRRIIENYFKILGKYGDDDLIKAFEAKEDQEICRSLICWINDGSHCMPDDLFIEHQGMAIDKYFEVFKKIFLQMGHFEHYKMMMGEIAAEEAVALPSLGETVVVNNN